jgi:hypothetical protein
MEKTDIGAVVPLSAGWNDLGSWEALWQTGRKDDLQNVIHGDVLHVASRLYDGLINRYSDMLINKLNFTRDALCGRQKQLIRLAALLHDIGHAPFSHAAEELMPHRENNETLRYTHENYTVGILKHVMRDVIENHPGTG